MSKKNTKESVESRVCFEQLEDWVREKIQSWVQALLEEEVTELLGRGKSERREAVESQATDHEQRNDRSASPSSARSGGAL